jgi:hypothetical protein
MAPLGNANRRGFPFFGNPQNQQLHRTLILERVHDRKSPARRTTAKPSYGHSRPPATAASQSRTGHTSIPSSRSDSSPR